jgi:DHA2 family multidrug resistance protein
MVIAQLTNTTVKMHAHLTEYVTPFSDALKMPDVRSILNTATDQGRAMIDALITQQASIIAYGNDFKLLMLLTLAAIPLVFLIRTSKHAGAADKGHEAVLD